MHILSPEAPFYLGKTYTRAHEGGKKREEKKNHNLDWILLCQWIQIQSLYSYYVHILFDSFFLSISLALLAFLSVNTGEEITYAIQILLENNTP